MARQRWTKIKKLFRQRWYFLITISALLLIYVTATAYIYVIYPDARSSNSWLSRAVQRITSDDAISETVTGLPPSEKTAASRSSKTKSSGAGTGSGGNATDTTNSANSGTGGSSGDGDSIPDTSSTYVAFYSDSQSDTDEEDTRHLKVVNKILASGANPVFHGGDLMEDGTQNSLNRFNNVAGGLVLGHSFYAALGNNDRTVGDPTTPSQLFLDNFVFSNNERWYSVSSGHLHMVVLDSAFCSGCASQLSWLASDLQSAASQSRITGVIFYHPSFVSTINSYLVNNGVDFVVDGHAHSYAKSSSGGIYYFTLPGGASLGYALASIYSDHVQFTIYNEDGVIIDSQTFSAR